MCRFLSRSAEKSRSRNQLESALVAAEVGGVGLRSRNNHTENFVVHLGSGRAKMTGKHIGSPGISECDLLQEILVVVKSSEGAYLVCVPEPAGLNWAASEQPHRGLQVERLIGAEDFHAGRGDDLNNESIKLNDEALPQDAFPGDQPGGYRGSLQGLRVGQRALNRDFDGSGLRQLETCRIGGGAFRCKNDGASLAGLLHDGLGVSGTALMEPFGHYLPAPPISDGDSATADQRADDLRVTGNDANGDVCGENVRHGNFRSTPCILHALRRNPEGRITLQDPALWVFALSHYYYSPEPMSSPAWKRSKAGVLFAVPASKGNHKGEKGHPFPPTWNPDRERARLFWPFSPQIPTFRGQEEAFRGRSIQFHRKSEINIAFALRSLQ